MRSPSPPLGPPAQGSSARKISPYNFWLQKPARSRWKKFLEPQTVPLKEPTHGFTYSDSKTPEKELNKMEKSNLSDAKCKTLVIRMIKELSEDLNSIKKIQSEMKDTQIDIKNNL